MAAAAAAAATASDDDPQSPTPPPPLAGPTSAAAVTVATTPRPLTDALAIQQPSRASASASASAANPNNGGREDCWSEGATSALIDAWGERYVDLGGILKQEHWQEVADAVSARDDYTKPPKSDVQCKNRIDTLKKKYKSEKSKIVAGQSHPSAWPFFHRLDILIGPNFLKPPASAAAAKAPAPPLAFPPHFPQKTRTQTVVNHSTSVKKRSRSPPPPPPPPEKNSDDPPPEERDGVGLRELTMAILRFGEVYERVERAKMQQIAEVEKQRMGFARELELQRMQFFVKTQMELSRMVSRPHKRRRGRGGGGGGGGGGGENNHRRCLDHHHHPHRRHHQTADNGNNSE